MPAFRSELILNLGVEGGAADIRREKASDGTWVFFCKTFSGGFDLSEFESAETPRKRLESKTFATLEGALEAFAGGAEWVFYFPTKVHPDFRDEVWELREQSLAKILCSDGDFHRHTNEQWARLCHREDLAAVSPPDPGPNT